MKILVDECCPAYLVEALREDDHDVIYVAETAPSTKDMDVLKQALVDERVLLTEDRDFCELIFLNNRPAFGVVLMRIHPTKRVERITRIREIFQRPDMELIGSVVTITLNNVRLRALPKRS